MRLSISLLASLGLIGTVAAQTPNQFDMYSGATNFTTRAAMPGTSVGDICQRYPSELLNCTGMTSVGGNVVNRVSHLYCVNQDQSGITQEQFTVGLIGHDPLLPPGTPGPDAALDIIRTGPFTTPSTTVTTAVAWIWTITLATPLDTLPARADYYTVCGLPANAAWVADGMSVHMSGWVNAPVVDNPLTTGALPIPNCVFTIDRTGAPIVAGRADRFQRIWWGGPGAMTRIGADIDPAFQVCPNPNYGAGGMYPNQTVTRLDGIAFKVSDANLPNTFCGTIGAIGGFDPTGTPLAGFGIEGDLCLPLFTILPITFASGVTDAAGVYQQTTFTFPNTWGANGGLGNMSFQSALLDFATPRVVMTNGAGFLAQ